MRTQNRPKAKLLLFLLICCAAFLSPFASKAQSTCASSTSLSPTTTFTLTDYSFANTDTVRWFSFTADSQRVYIDIEDPVSPADTPVAHVHTVELYSGSCTSLTLLALRDINSGDSVFTQSAILKIPYNGLTIGQTYHIRVTRRTPTHCAQSSCHAVTSYFSMAVQNQSSVAWVCTWPGTLYCGENIQNGGYEYIDPTWNSGCPFDITYPGDPIVGCPWDGMPLPSFVTSTPDFFNSCSNPSDVGVALNGFGTQASHSGNGYAGIVGLVQQPAPYGNGFEGIMQTFTTPLTGGKVYYEEMWVSLADISSLGTSIGFTSFPVGGSNDYYHPSVITSKTTWTKVSHCFTADGTEVNRAITWNGCPSSLTPVSLTSDPGYTYSNPPYPTAYFYIDDVSIRQLAYAGPSITTCNFSATIGCTAMSPISGATYSWSVAGPSGVTIISPTSQSTNVTFTTAGTYTFTITTTLGSCSDTDVMTVTVNGISSTISASASTICLGSSSNLSVSTTPSTGPFTYAWTPSGSGLSSYTINNPVATPTVTTTYSVLVTNTATGCTTTATTTITVSSPSVTITPPSPDNTCGTSVYASTVTGGTSPYTYSWAVSSGGTIVGSNTNSSVTVNWNGAGTNQTATVTVTDAIGCVKTATITVLACCYPSSTSSTRYAINNINATTFLANTSDPNITGNVYNNAQGVNGEIVINGTFTIDQSLTIKNSIIHMGPNAKIVIPTNSTGITLSIICSELSAGCKYMWDGIYANGTNSTVAIAAPTTYTAPTLIRDAENAVVSVSGGIFNINGVGNGVYFRDNFKCIVVQPYSGSNSSFVKHTTFETDATGLIAPRTGQITNIGIDISQANYIAIGNGTSSTFQNSFNKMYIGIKSDRSNVDIMNNRFQNMAQQPVNTCCATNSCSNPILCGSTGVAIWVIGGTISSNLTANIGGTGSSQNIISSCSNGIRVDNSINVSIKNNDFTLSTAIPSFSIGVNVQNDVSLPFSWSTPHAVLIEGNNFHTFKTAISTRTNHGSKMDIRNNTINSSAPSSNTTAISVQDASGGANGYTKVQGNAIDNTWIGVKAVTITKGYIDKGSQPTANVINLTTVTTATANLYGIWAQSCNQMTISSNSVTKVSGTASSSSASHWLGIRFDNSPAIYVVKNTVTNCGSGLYGFQSSPGSRLACNNLNSCYYGVYFNGANVGTQLTSSVANQNKWTSNIATNKIDGSIVVSSMPWYYNTTAFGASTLPTPQGVVNLSPTSTSNSFDVCPTMPNYPANITVAERQSMFGLIVHDSVQFSSDTVENKYADNQYVYQQFLDSTSWLALGDDASDAIFQNYFDSIQAGEIGDFLKVQQYIYEGDAFHADSLNSLLSPVSLMATNRKTVSDIYIKNVSLGQFAYSSADSTTLHTIAVENPLIGGEGVYIARTMLDLVIYDIYGFGSRMFNPVADTAEFIGGKVYPNPNTGSMQLDYSLKPTESGQLIIFDLSGKKINTYKLLEGENTLIIDERQLEPGVYFYNIVINGELKMTDKIVIIK